MDSQLQQAWKKLAALKPKLRSHIQVHRHDYRGQICYLLEDKLTGRKHRFSAKAYLFIDIMDGQRTLENIWRMAHEHLQDKLPPQTELIRLVGTLNAADMLDTKTLPDPDKIYERQQQQKQSWKKRFSNPLSIRIPLTDPDKYLCRFLPYIEYCLTRVGLWIWFCSLLFAGLLMVSHWPEFVAHTQTNIFTPTNLLLMWLTYPFIKLLHELGHAFAVKYWGGDVHEMGVMLLLFTPVPYVDASAASTFNNKHHRMIVGAAGIGVEVFIASWALFVWANSSSGLIHDLAFNIMLMGGVSTLLFNGNPLLKYDGYYILSDMIGIPNLASRSKQYFGYCVQRYIYNLKSAQQIPATKSEQRWFIFYAIASWIYRMGLLIFIVTYLIKTFFVPGVILAIWAIGFQIVLPTYKYLIFVMQSPIIHPQRQRVLTILSSTTSFILLFITFVPMPFYTMTEGVISLPDEAQIRTQSDGFVSQVMVSPGEAVIKGTQLIKLEDPELQTQLDILDARHRELKAQHLAHWSNDQVQAGITREKIVTILQERQRLDQKIQALSINSPAVGSVILPQAQDLPGRYLRQGTLLGYIATGAKLQVKTVFSQEDAGLLKHIDSVTARVVGQTEQVVHAELKRITPEARQRLPSPVLSQQGGGQILTEADDKTNQVAQQKYFHVELSLPKSSPHVLIGQRVYLKFDYGSASLVIQAYRHFRQFFLNQLQTSI